ncbi:biotin-dependent carboxyltransferase family protein [Alteribacillus sp. YIM 98480]|uniref:5-oxoprolinase subunit C family protein n=1 Tax=Alteribacillus sp. YIM 98480 TaxID=2606599 RepID=UPI00131ADC07|nr:biotin-dependent carboxyltransferase family protein [Alteribacillus sp. YIM 98480]
MNEFLKITNSKLAAIQDSGRYGFEHHGISVNGAVDQFAYLAGNLLAGNEFSQPVIEVTAFDFSMKSSVDIPVCITGAPADVSIDDKPVKMWENAILPADKVLSIKKIRQGLKVYIAVGGELDVPSIYGSSSLDVVANFGKKLFSGEIIRLKNINSIDEFTKNPPSVKGIPQYGSPWNIRICDGPESEVFTENFDYFYNSSYKVSTDSNHIGIRLKGPRLSGYSPTEVLSKGVSIGAVEVIPTGQLIILHRGRSVTAGYPVIGVVASVDLGLIGQARPNDDVHFTRISVDEATELYKNQFEQFSYLQNQL